MKDPHQVVWTPERIQQLWDFYARSPIVDTLYFSKSVGPRVVKTIGKHIAMDNAKVLDYGGGPGYLVEALTAKYPRAAIWGADFSPDSVSAMRQRLANRSNFQRAMLVDELEQLADSSLDVLISCEVIEHLDDDELQKFSARAYRLLKRGGFLCLTTPNSEDLAENSIICPECACIFHKWQHVRSWDALSLTHYFSNAGFDSHLCKPTNFGSFGPLRFIARKFQKRKVPYPNLLYIGVRR